MSPWPKRLGDRAGTDDTSGSSPTGTHVNYYLVYRQTGGSSVLRISRVVAGVETVLKQRGIPNPARGAWFRLGARADGGLVTLLLDGVPLLTASDGTFAEGTLGLLLSSKGPLSLPADDFKATAE